ncbi:hypothetical protein BH09ACT1_BH09ACT1_16520 [soil metagenome]
MNVAARHRLLVFEPTHVRLEPYPAGRIARWVLRAGLALPFLLLATIDAKADTAQTQNGLLVGSVSTIDWPETGVSSMVDLFPPIGTAVAALVGSLLGLAIVGSLVAGYFLQVLIETMHQGHFPLWKVALFLIAVGGNPLFAYTVVSDIQSTLAICFFGFGIVNSVRFIANKDTQAGFRAGLQFLIAALSSPMGIVYVIAASITAPLFDLARQGQRGARASNVLIMVFPTVSAFASVCLLEFVFAQNPFALFTHAYSVDASRLDVFGNLIATPEGFLVLATLVVGAVFALIVRRPGSILVSFLLALSLIGGYLLGVVPPSGFGNVFILLAIMGVAILPLAKAGRSSLAGSIIAVAQTVIIWLAAFNLPVIAEWMTRLTQLAGIR